jgi:uncharacterized membrane protein YoaK (UPF0700 family)
MFRHLAAARSDRANRTLAAYLASLGGYVNTAGFVLIGTFTSHVTGNVGRFANDLASGQPAAAAAALTMIVAFFTGALVASMAIESDFFGRIQNAYAFALSTEAALLALFAVVSNLTVAAHPRLKDMEAAILCVAMGMQNSLVTRISGAVIRTTHLTGVITDLGIEAARWFRWWRHSAANAIGVPLSFGKNSAERPNELKIALLGTIAGAFAAGSVAGSLAGVTLRHAAMIPPSAALVAGAIYAARTRAQTIGSVPPGPASRR